MRDLHRCLCLLVLLLFSSVPAPGAAVPVVDHFHPVAAQIGSTSLVSVIGKTGPWPTRVWVEKPGLRFNATTNKGEFSVEVDASATAGAYWVRVFNEDGASRPRCFLVDPAAQTLEVEPNDEFVAPQAIAALPAQINGRLAKSGDVDSFAVDLAAGQTLVARLEAYVLESPLDAVIRMTDARGGEVAWNHDGRTLDPFLTFTAAESGRYVVQVLGFPHPATSEIRFHGSDKCVYHLRLSAGPQIAYTLPLGARRTGSTRLQLMGWNLPASLARDLNFTPSPTDCASGFASLRPSAIENFAQIPLGDGPEKQEHEPNDGVAEANSLEVPGAVTGCVSHGNDVDRFQFVARKGERHQWSVQAVSLGFPVDAWIKIENSNGVQAARSEGGNGRDPELSWTPGQDGVFQVSVGSLVHRGGSNAWYRLSGARPVPDFKVSVAAESFVFTPGTTNDVKVTVNRLDGFTNRLSVQLEGGPGPGSVLAAPVEVPDKGGEVTLKLVVSTNAAAYGGPIQIVASSAVGTNDSPALKRTAEFSFVSTSENNGVPGGFRELRLPSIDQLWLTVRPAEAKKAEEKSGK